MCSFSWVATSPVALAFGNVRTNTMERRHTHTHKNTYIHSHPYALRSDHAAVLLLGAPYNISLLRSCSPSHSDYRTPVAFYVIPFLCKASPNLHLLSRNLSLSLSLSFYLSLYFLYRKDCEVDAAVPNVSAVQRATVRATCHTRTMHCQRLNVSCRRAYDTPTRESMCPRIPMVLSINAGRVRRDRTTFRVHTYAGVNFLRFQHQ